MILGVGTEMGRQWQNTYDRENKEKEWMMAKSFWEKQTNVIKQLLLYV